MYLACGAPWRSDVHNESIRVQFSVAEVALLEPQTEYDERLLREVSLPREKKMSTLGIMIQR
eukprot:1209488-Pyramimonas_sp.AAC.1